MRSEANRIAIIGAGNLGQAIARGLVESGRHSAGHITLTRRKPQALDWAGPLGFAVTSDNLVAVADADVVIVAVEPQQLDGVLSQIAPALDGARHVLVSVASGATIAQLRRHVGEAVPVVRAMPNTAVAIRESMTCMASDGADEAALGRVRALFDTVGKTLVIDEEQMSSATALGACGVAFFLRAVRAASQGGIEIGFHAEDALAIAAQTARGAASLLVGGSHPEHEIDKVTTPRGCTIAGLNTMEHEGFSSAMIKGITLSAKQAGGLYADDED